jgi:mono/diheme cytochrome c family protein
MKPYRFAIACVLTLALGGMLVAQSTANLYKSKCQGCHGAEGKATAVGKKLGARDFSDPDVTKMSEADLEKITAEGKNKMPAYKGKLTDDQIKDLAKYIRELK